MHDWYYEIDGEKKGPIGEVQLKELMKSGVIKPDTIIYEVGIMKPSKAIDSDFYKNGFAPFVWGLPFGSFVWGIMSIVCGPWQYKWISLSTWLGICSFASYVSFGVFGLIFGILALRAIKEGKVKGYPYAILGTSMSLISIILLIILYAMHS